MTYADAGVNIDAGNALVERIKPLAKATARAGLMGGIGGFGALFDVKACGYKDPILVSGTDGVGTKIKLAIELGRHDAIGVDLVAMCVNDLVVQGAEPLFFLDYFATSKLDVAVAERVIAGIAEGCKQAGCALVGGETAEMPGMYAPGDYDLAGFAVGAVEREAVLPQGVQAGDVVLGLASNGFHSTGFSLVRHVLKSQAKGGPDVVGLLAPTRIYVVPCLKAIKAGGVRALAHITGGGLTENLPRVLPDGVSVEIDLKSWNMPAPFQWIEKEGNIAQGEMLRTFNCGIGMVAVVAAEKADALKAVFEREGEKVHVIGRIVARQKERVVYV